ncbi:serine-threonine protein kinase 19-domain-containing protein [Mycotypha africana]|uniref:serine-threonine protein kinase 19-domain-containing protein n=1 Tax=Mycotypha africana TaxID=64632 RepID=UPI0022FFEB51|nr:serine-threonine protein kinase 19-domain-containing protein [Mycotypha africana]KAI8969114.1 serine-threonine protein kinase 19-domain-containing protein [Mycotypha africana]
MSQRRRRQRIAAEQELYRIQQGAVYKPDVYQTKKHSTHIRRAQLQQTTHNDEEFSDLNEELDLEDHSDAVMTAEYLIQNNTKSILPLCFIHQLYSILSNNTMTDREIQASLQRNSWKKFFIMGCLEDEYVIMKTTNYCNLIDQSKADYIKEHNEEEAHIFNIFQKIVLDKDHNKISIDKDTLINTFRLTDKEISHLVSAGLLLPHNIQIDLFWFSVPKQGTFVTNLLHGRKSILNILRKRATKDIMESVLRQKKLHKCTFNVDFLLHDLVGSGRVERHMTPMGNLIRLTSKGEKGI